MLEDEHCEASEGSISSFDNENQEYQYGKPEQHVLFLFLLLSLEKKSRRKHYPKRCHRNVEKEKGSIRDSMIIHIPIQISCQRKYLEHALGNITDAFEAARKGNACNHQIECLERVDERDYPIKTSEKQNEMRPKIACDQTLDILQMIPVKDHIKKKKYRRNRFDDYEVLQRYQHENRGQ